MKHADFFTLSLLLPLKWDLNLLRVQNLTLSIQTACLHSKWFQYLLLVTQLENTLSIQEVITFSGDKDIFHETTTENNSNRVALVCMEEL